MAKVKGTYRGSGPRISDADLREMRKLLEAGIPRSAVAKAFGIARQTLYKREVLERMGWEPPSSRTTVVVESLSPEPIPAPRVASHQVVSLPDGPNSRRAGHRAISGLSGNNEPEEVREWP